MLFSPSRKWILHTEVSRLSGPKTQLENLSETIPLEIKISRNNKKTGYFNFNCHQLQSPQISEIATLSWTIDKPEHFLVCRGDLHIIWYVDPMAATFAWSTGSRNDITHLNRRHKSQLIEYEESARIEVQIRFFRYFPKNSWGSVLKYKETNYY